MIRVTFLLLVFVTACVQAPLSEGGLEDAAYTQRLYIATNGNDANPGTLAQPFKTIQKCADVATPGTACLIRAGTYRETVRPANSGQSGLPILFKPYNNETVLVSGADVVTNWTASSGSIYKAPVAWNLGVGYNQVFVDGKMMIEARYPNASLDLLAPWQGKVMNPSGSKPTYTIAASNVPANLTGANINIVPGPEWVVETARITSSTASSFTFKANTTGQIQYDAFYAPRVGNPYFIWGKRVLLDAANEWFLENGQLYLWAPNNANPNSRTVEVKRRSYAFDLTDRSYIAVNGLHIFAATITTGDVNKSANEATAQNITLNNIHVRYPSHFTFVNEDGWSDGRKDTGLILYGRNHVLKNSTVVFSAGNGVTLAGNNHKVTNNIIHDVGYAATDAAAVKAGSYDFTTTQNLIQYNTFYNSGRGVVGHPDAKALKILNNHLYNAGLLLNDLGMVGSPGDGGGTEIAYNLVHDNFAPNESVGIYLDNNSSNYVVHHNIVYNVKTALNLNLPTRNNKIYNNTFVGFKEGVSSGSIKLPGCDATGTVLSNNIFSMGHNLGFVFDGNTCPRNPDGTGKGIPTFINNLEQNVNPLLVDAPDANFILGAGSPAIDTGRVLSPYTNGFTGSAPDMGALESGLAPFRVGATITEPCVYGDSCTPKPKLNYGVVAEYFSDEDLTTLTHVRLEGTFDFGYYRDGMIPPGTFLPRGTNYSARWMSYLKAPITGTYTFTVSTDDGSRFWINGTQYVDQWNAYTVETFTVSLQAGQYYDLKLEMRQGTGDAQAKLEWEYVGQPKQTIPLRYLTINKP
jgi:hypothetical protein